MDEYKIVCVKCEEDINAPSDPQPDSLCACPKCEASDTYTNVVEEAKAYVIEQVERQLQGDIKNVAAQSKIITYKPGQIATREYRFKAVLR